MKEYATKEVIEKVSKLYYRLVYIFIKVAKNYTTIILTIAVYKELS